MQFFRLHFEHFQFFEAAVQVALRQVVGSFVDVFRGDKQFRLDFDKFGSHCDKLAGVLDFLFRPVFNRSDYVQVLLRDVADENIFDFDFVAPDEI